MSNQKNSEPAKLGLRERKKQQTRLAISVVATRMFIERGFDQVTIAEVAAAADVSVNTVFNYFTTKEELFFDRAAEVIDAPSRVVRERKRGETPVQALRRNFRKLLKDGTESAFSQRFRPFLATLHASAALQARGRMIVEQTEEQLAQTLQTELSAPPTDPTARALAALITGLQSLLLREFAQRIMAGEPEQVVREEVSRLGERGFELLLTAAGDYGKRA